MPRLDREIISIAGIGGHIMPYRFSAIELQQVLAGQLLFAGPFLEISTWRVRHMQRLIENTHSGSGGAIKRVLVAQDFDFAAEIPWNGRLIAIRSKESVGFMENLLVGAQASEYNVAILFSMGDALSYDTQDAGGTDFRAFLYAPQALLQFAEVINDSTGTDIVRVNIRGQGNSLLKGFRGSTLLFNDTSAAAEPSNPAGT